MHPHTIDPDAAHAPIPVAVVNFDAVPPPPARLVEISSQPRTIVLDGVNTLYGLLLPHSPYRKRATVAVIGGGGGTAYICQSQGDAQKSPPQGAQVVAGQVLDLRGTDELWCAVASGVAINFGVIPEVRNPG